jgi:proton-dependent oligopeptide transporter, POT family
MSWPLSVPRQRICYAAPHAWSRIVSMSEAVVAAPGTILGQPRGLWLLFFVEMWERFSYYGMRALLIFYLTQHFLFGDAAASAIYASYGSLVYLMPLLGGLIADRYLGFRKAVGFGAVLLCIGHFGMAIEGDAALVTADGVQRDPVSLQIFYASLAFIIIGVGFLKPNISSMVGQLYAKDDPRRDGGFTYFYMGINLGAMLASSIVGYLGQTFGWAYGFGLAGVGMLAGLITFRRGLRLLGDAGLPSDANRLTEIVTLGLTRERLIYIAGLIGVVFAWQLVQSHQLVGQLLMVAAVVTVVGIIGFAVLRLPSVERDRMLVVLFLTAVSVVFWAFFEQAGSSMNLFAERNVDRHMLGVDVQATQFQSLNPAFILLLGPVFSLLWVALARRGFEPSTPAKFGLGVLQVGLGFAALVYGAQQADSSGLVAAGWLALAYLLHTTGELCLSPVGLSMVTKLSVPRVVGLMMGVWFLSSAFSHYVAGLIAAGASANETPGATVGGAESLAVYVATFSTVAWIAVAVGVVVLLLSPLVRRFMHEPVRGTER